MSCWIPVVDLVVMKVGVMREVAALEVKVLQESANAEELARYKVLNQELPTDLGALADRRLRGLGVTR